MVATVWRLALIASTTLRLPGSRNDKLEAYPMAKLILSTARKEASKKARHLKHPGYCLDVIEYGVEHGGEAGLRKVSGVCG